MSAEDRSAAEQRLLGEATEWRLISLLLESPREGWWAQLTALASETADPDLRSGVQAAQEEANEGLYHSLFGPGGPAPPREVSFRGWVQPGQLLAELAAYYDAFSYSPRIDEVADHVSVEAGFVAYLRLKEAYALACSNEEHALVTADAARRFIEEHLAPMAQPLAAALRDSGVAYLAYAGEALLRRTGPPRSDTQARLLPVLQEDESVFECGEGVIPR